MFTPINSAELTYRLVYNDNHALFRWDKAPVVFSAARRGNAMSCHFAAPKEGLRHLKQALNEFVQFVFELNEWCTMIIAVVKIDSVSRLIGKIGFEHVIDAEEHKIYARTRQWAE